MRINTNIASLNAQANNAQTNSKLSSSLEKLSSGLQINKAADDASGMAIADKLRTQASSIGQGISNANSASALIQIADKAMSEQSNILDTVKTKLIQASTSTTSAEGREAVRKDIQKLLEQFDNISGQTNYNGTNLLDKKDAEFSFQVGEESTFDIGLSTAYAVNTQGLGSGQELINDEKSLMNIDGEAYIESIGSQLTAKHDSDTATSGATERRAVSINSTATAATSGFADFKIEAENVQALTFDLSGAANSVTLTTTDEALIAAFDANTNLTNTGEKGVYTIAASTNVEFATKIDISDLEVSGAISGLATGSNDEIGVVTDDFVTVTKTGGAGSIGLVAGEQVAGEDAVTPVVAVDLIAKASSSADGITYATGPIVEQGTIAVQHKENTGLAANLSASVSVTNTHATTEASYTVNADKVGQINLVAVAGNELTLTTNDAGMIAKLDEMAENNGSLERLNSGAYTFAPATDGDTANLDFEGFDVKDLTISGQLAAEVVTIQTDEAVSITKSSDSSDENHLQLNSATTNTDTKVVAAAPGELKGANAEGMQFSSTLAGLTTLGENELTADKANEFMSVIDNAMTQLNSVRSDFGSTQNQLEVATRNMMVTQVNIKAAESVIRDTDYAAESASFNKQNIIAQAGTYAMSQANSMQQNVMRLLQ